ncbi:ABC transporter ATP-binding protein [soil metagenome]
MCNPYFALLGTCWKFAYQEKRRYIIIYSLFIGANLIIAMTPIIYGWFINGLQKEGVNYLKYAWIYGISYLLLKLLEWSLHGPARIMERNLAFKISQNFMEDLYHKVLHLPLEWHKDHHSGATINRIKKAYDALRGFFQNGFVYLYGFCKFLFSFAAIIYFSPLFGSIGALLGIFTIWVITKFDKPFIKSLKEVIEGQHKVSSNLFDSLSNIVTVITLRLEKRMEAGLLVKVQNIFPSFRKNVVVNEWKWFTAQMLVAVIYVVITIGFVYQNWVPGEVFLIGGLVTMIGFVNQFTSVFYDIASQYTNILQYHTDVKTVDVISNDYDRQHRPEAAKPLPLDWKIAQINNLNFSHSEKSSGSRRFTGLNNLSLQIKRGERVALIGESGSGKSTLLALLRGLYAAQQGVQVDIDGQGNYDLSSIAETVTLLPQEPEIFENTINYNITLGLPFSDEEIIQVCEIAKFSEVVDHLPDGLETMIQENGVNLSGGQKQRLALARGILAARTSKIILMDEPTSSVDLKTERLLYQQLFKAFEGKAIISSLHRLHLLPFFDYIYIIENGKVIDEGTFEYLRLSSPNFAELWQHQEDRNSLSVA